MASAYPAPSAAATVNSTSAPEPTWQDHLHNARESFHNATRALENGFLFGLGDRARAGISAVIGDGSYGDNLSREQAQTNQFRKDHPIAAPILESTGIVAAPLGAIGAAAKATTLGGKTLAGAGAGGAIGTLQGAAESPDWTDVRQTAKDAAASGGANAFVGMAIPGVGQLIGAGVRGVSNAVRGTAGGMSRAASAHLTSAFEADTPAAVRQALSELGPEGMLADAGPAMLGKTQGASLNSDEARSIAQTALRTRDQGTNARVMGDVERALGPAEDPQTVTNAIITHRSNVDNAAYPAALGNAPEVQTAPILTRLDDMIGQAPVGSMEHRALTNLRDMMMTTERRPLLDAHGYPQYDRLGNERFQDVPVSQNDANILHKVKGELDNVIQYDAPGLGVPAGALARQQGSLKLMRGELNDALEHQVPGYLEANRQSAALARRGEAVEAGTQYLGAGKTTPSPDRFAIEHAQREPGEQIAFGKGSRGEVDRLLGTKINDLQALKQVLQGEGGWNAAKIGTVHGPDAASQLIDSVDRNIRYRGTFNKVNENSQTAQRTAAANAMKPVPPNEVPLINPNMSLTGALSTAAKKAAEAGANAFRPDPTRSYGEIARILTAQGGERDAHVSALAGALARRDRNSATSQAIGNRSALAAAIAGTSRLKMIVGKGSCYPQASERSASGEPGPEIEPDKKLLSKPLHGQRTIENAIRQVMIGQLKIGSRRLAIKGPKR